MKVPACVIQKPKDSGGKRKKKNHVRRDLNKERRDDMRELTKLLSAYVIARDGETCNWCEGSNIPLYGAHVLPKGRCPRLEFEPYNIMTLCYACHLGNGGWHKDPNGAVRWFEGKYPGRYERLLIANRCAPKVDLKLLLNIWRNTPLPEARCNPKL